MHLLFTVALLSTIQCSPVSTPEYSPWSPPKTTLITSKDNSNHKMLHARAPLIKLGGFEGLSDSAVAAKVAVVVSTIATAVTLTTASVPMTTFIEAQTTTSEFEQFPVSSSTINALETNADNNPNPPVNPDVVVPASLLPTASSDNLIPVIPSVVLKPTPNLDHAKTNDAVSKDDPITNPEQAPLSSPLPSESITVITTATTTLPVTSSATTATLPDNSTFTIKALTKNVINLFDTTAITNSTLAPPASLMITLFQLNASTNDMSSNDTLSDSISTGQTNTRIPSIVIQSNTWVSAYSLKTINTALTIEGDTGSTLILTLEQELIVKKERDVQIAVMQMALSDASNRIANGGVTVNTIQQLDQTIVTDDMKSGSILISAGMGVGLIVVLFSI